MKLSEHFGRTLREAPGDVSTVSDGLALRAGLARRLENIGWTYLPIGTRVLHQLEAVVLESLVPLGGEEIKLPTGAPILNTIFALSAQEVESYRDLPRLLVTFEAHPPIDEGRALLLAATNNAHFASLHTDPDDLAAGYEQIVVAIADLLSGIGLDVRRVAAVYSHDEHPAHALMLSHKHGRGGLVTCSSCDYGATAEAANFARRDARFGEPAELEKVETPDCHTIAELCAFLDIDPGQTLKLVIYTINFNQPGEAVVMALLRGDLDVSEAKLMHVLGADHIEPTTEDMIVETGAVAGYASPIGLNVRPAGGDAGVLVIADESLRQMSNFVTGANEAGYHYINANAPRDFDVTRYADIAQPYEGAFCPSCGGSLHVESAIELGTTRLASRNNQATFLPASGNALPLLIADYNLFLDRVIAGVIEAHHDDYGIIWPQSIAPYDVHIVAIGKNDDEEAVHIADKLYADLQSAGAATLYDDRLASPGVMFNDADLIGIPLRITVGARSLENGGVEVKRRAEKDREILPLEGLVDAILRMIPPQE